MPKDDDAISEENFLKELAFDDGTLKDFLMNMKILLSNLKESLGRCQEEEIV